jgi:hypothetical protein
LCLSKIIEALSGSSFECQTPLKNRMKTNTLLGWNVHRLSVKQYEKLFSRQFVHDEPELLREMHWISLLKQRCGNLVHSSISAPESSCRLFGSIGRVETAFCSMSQACSIGFMSGEQLGHSIRSIVSFSR